MHEGQFPLILVILQFVAIRSKFAGFLSNNRAQDKTLCCNADFIEMLQINKMRKLTALNINQIHG